MNKGGSFSKNSKEDTEKSENKCKTFKDISKYFSKEEWANLEYSDKITYVYMKRNYDTMTSLGEPRQGPSDVQDQKQMKVMLEKQIKEESDSEPIPITPGSEQPQKELCPLGKASTSGQESENIPGPRKRMSSIWAFRLRERKNLIVYEEISDPEEDD
ncbi:putative protein SSX6 isoform X2 [Zalophus californianus]|uniref:Uncharacterized protein n=1 Tax=Zalophus californianus TaxID=9704 RepID=A0A6J2ED13_ZALCA|nr:putative protein SSX6 isoform X2 [Zalophus californianus]